MQITREQLNPRQARTFSDVLGLVLFTDSYEVKDLTIEDNEWNDDVYVQLEVGRKGDEGTLAECICRDCYAFSIGKRGGIYYYDSKSHDRVYIKYWDILKRNIWK